MTAKIRSVLRRFTLRDVTHTVRLRIVDGREYFSIEDLAAAVHRSPNKAVTLIDALRAQEVAPLDHFLESADTVFATAEVVAAYLRSVNRLTDAVADALNLDERIEQAVGNTRQHLTDSLKAAGFDSEGYREVYRALYAYLFGWTTEQFREANQLGPKASVRSHLSTGQKGALYSAEALLAYAVRRRIERGDVLTPLKVRRTLSHVI